MAISLVGQSSAVGTSATASITHGLTINSGDFVVVQIGCNGAATTPTLVDFTACTGYPLASGTATGTIAYRTATGSEAASYSFALSASDRWVVNVSVWRAAGSISWDVEPTPTGPTPATVTTIPQITTLTADTVLLAFCASDNTAITYSNFTNGFGNVEQINGGQSGFIASKAQAVAGATGSMDFTSSAQVATVIGMGAIKESAAALAIDSTPSEINPTVAFSIQVSNPATAPTTGNTLGNFNGLTKISPDSVTGSDPYTITWTLPRTTAKKFDATGYVFDIDIDVESVSSSAIPYLPPTGSDYITIGTPDTGTTVYTGYTGGTFVTGDQLVWTDSPALSFTDDTNFIVTGPLTATIYRIAADGTVDVENNIVFAFASSGTGSENEKLIAFFRNATGSSSYNLNELAIGYYKQAGSTALGQFNDALKAAQAAVPFKGYGPTDWRN